MSYHFVDRQGRGKAEQLELRENYRLMKMLALRLVCKVMMLGKLKRQK